MLLIAEIILTIFAWRKGWKGLALIPLGVAFGLGLILGLNGVAPDDLASLIWVDVLAIIALIVMTVKGPKNDKEVLKD
jgi:hypothetical protein